jgi:hypothetical protein
MNRPLISALSLVSAAFIAACAGASRGTSTAAPVTTNGIRTITPGDESGTPTNQIVLVVAADRGVCAADDMCAVRAVLEQLLFRGVPGSRQPSPIVADEKAARDAHQPYFAGLLKGDAGRRYVSDISRRPDRSYVVAINADLLRDDLVKQGIIRRFGY